MSKLSRDANGQLDAYAWPSGYPLYYLDSQNGVLCVKCARKSDDPEEVDSFRPVAVGVNYEDALLFCDDCSQRIESAYEKDTCSVLETGVPQCKEGHWLGSPQHPVK